MSSPTRESIYIGLLYVGLARFRKIAGIALYRALRYRPKMRHDSECRRILELQIEDLNFLMGAKGIADVCPDADASENEQSGLTAGMQQASQDCKGTCTRIRSGVGKLVEAIRRVNRFANSRLDLAGNPPGFFDVHRDHLEDVEKIFVLIDEVIDKLNVLYPNVTDIQWNRKWNPREMR